MVNTELRQEVIARWRHPTSSAMLFFQRCGMFDWMGWDLFGNCVVFHQGVFELDVADGYARRWGFIRVEDACDGQDD